MASISQVPLHQDKEDLWLWNGPPSYSFSVKFAYKILTNHGTRSVQEVFAYLWNLKVMPSTQFYVWRALSDRIATMLNLYKRRVMLTNTLCVLCKREEESISHILVSCKVSILVWNMCNRWLGISSVNHNEVVKIFEQFSTICFNNEGNKLWKSIWVSVI